MVAGAHEAAPIKRGGMRMNRIVITVFMLITMTAFAKGGGGGGGHASSGGGGHAAPASAGKAVGVRSPTPSAPPHAAWWPAIFGGSHGNQDEKKKENK